MATLKLVLSINKVINSSSSGGGDKCPCAPHVAITNNFVLDLEYKDHKPAILVWNSANKEEEWASSLVWCIFTII